MPNDSSQNQDGPEPNTQQVFVAPTAQFSPSSATSLNVKKPKKSKKTLFAILSAVGVFVLVAGGTIIYLLLNNGTSEPVVQSNTVDLPALGDAIKATAKDQSTASVMIDNTSPLPELITKIGNSVWIHPDDGANQLVYYSRQASAADSDTDYAATVSYLTSNKFTETTINDKAVANRFFSNDTTVCVVKKGQDGPGSGAIGASSSSNAVNVYCALKTDFAKNEDKFKPYLSLYEANPIEGAADVIFRSVTVQASAVKDYNNANLTIAKVFSPTKFIIGKFYQTPDHNWHYLATVDNQDAVPCATFSSDELKSAFLGTPCWDKATSTTLFVHFPISTPENDPNADPADN